MIPLAKQLQDFFKENTALSLCGAVYPLGWVGVYLFVTPQGGGLSLWPYFIYSCLYVGGCLGSLAYMHIQLQKVLLVDPVTNVYNKRYFFRALDTEFSRSKRAEAPLALVTFSLLNIGLLSEELGRSPEYVHRVFCETVAGTIRETDVFSRVDPNTYTLLLANTDDAGAQTLARRLETLVMREFRKVKPALADVVAFGICCTQYSGCKEPIDIYDNAAKAHTMALASERNRIMSCMDGVCQTTH
ncbi:diguanylate cyclase [Desulfovibrio subterraneus]|jgi:diguanylate cyclase (GGDEF)-like protein|uniref:GGDEF domain-containing protein n=1 Tax=Desulfovibrio subterraneus TaxID=2718620 RepID=UPI0022B91A06|nr:diguanylate cyclase [Desulfovibrio subterraneus]WBF67436.1 diguanylate cyclase [Desulfovibrio subterraneus]